MNYYNEFQPDQDHSYDTDFVPDDKNYDDNADADDDDLRVGW